MARVVSTFLLGFYAFFLKEVNTEVVIAPVNVTVSENQAATLTCTLTGTAEAITYVTWFYKTGTETAVGTVGVLDSACASLLPVNTSVYEFACPGNKQITCTIKMVTRQNHEDRYQCNIATVSGNDNSGFTFLQVQVPISSVTMTVPSSASVTVYQGTSTVFKCKTSGGLPAATVNWYKDSGTPGDFSDDIEITSNVVTSSSTVNDLIEVTSTLTYSPSKNDNGWRIYCTASNINGQTPTVSQRNPLLNAQYPADGPPVITGYTSGGEYRVIESTQGQLSCSVSGGNPAPHLTWDCINSGAPQTMSSGTATKVHTWMAERGQDKTCTCTASHYSGNTDVSIRITILYPPTKPIFKINSTPVSQIVKVIRHNSLSVTCSSEGQPEPSYKWTLPDRTTRVGSQLTVSSVQNNGRYTCDVQNTMDPSVGNSVPRSNSSFVDVLILYAPSSPSFNYWNTSGASIPTKYLDVIKDDTFYIACLSNGEPTPTFQWNNQGTSQILTVNYVASNQTHTCTVRNTMVETVGQTLDKSATATLKINVFYPPSVVTMKYHYGGNSLTLSTTLSIIEGNPFKVTCSSDSRPYPSHKWTGTVSRSSDTVEITSTSKSHAGTYVCEVENSMTRTFPNPEREVNGKKNGSFTLHVLHPPVIEELKNTSVIEGSPTVISCPVTFGNPPETMFKWIRNGAIWKTSQNVSINEVSRSDAMVYTCNASNSMQQTGEEPVSQPDTKSFYLNVLYRTSVTSFFIEGNEASLPVQEHHGELKFICEVDSNPAAILNIIFDGKVLKREANTMNLTFAIKRVACLDMGVYTCEGYNNYGPPSRKDVTLVVICPPRPLHRMKENVTSLLYVPITLQFTAIAYPPLGPEGFSWAKQNGNWWTPLLSNADLQISAAALQTNLTILNVSYEDFGIYRLNATNSKGSYVQYFRFSKDDQTQSSTDNAGVFAGTPTSCTYNTPITISLGILCCGFAVYAVTVSIVYKRSTTLKGTQSQAESGEQKSYVNVTFKSDFPEHTESQNEHPDIMMKDAEDDNKSSESPYTSLSGNFETTYDELK